MQLQPAVSQPHSPGQGSFIGTIVAFAVLTVHLVVHEGGHGALNQQDVVYVLLKMLILQLVLEFHK